MNNRYLMWAIGAILLVISLAIGFSLAPKDDGTEASGKTERAQDKGDDSGERTCASTETYSRLKDVLFEQAARASNADAENLELLANNSVVRMENPVVESRDEERNATVCSGRFVLELPPGAERGVGGERRLVADVEYGAQPAADGSGLVYRLSGAEAIVGKLSAFKLQSSGGPALADDQSTGFSRPSNDTPTEEPVQRSAPPPVDRPGPEPRPVPRAETTTATANPSFNCRSARTRGEIMVCQSPRLASLDRSMSSLYFSSLSEASGPARRALQTSRNRFLAYRDRCPSEACIAQAYQDRMREIRDIMRDLN